MRDSGLQWNVHEVALVDASTHIPEGQAMPHKLSESSAARSRLWQSGGAVQTAVLTGEGPSQVLILLLLDVAHSRARVDDVAHSRARVKEFAGTSSAPP